MAKNFFLSPLIALVADKIRDIETNRKVASEGPQSGQVWEWGFDPVRAEAELEELRLAVSTIMVLSGPDGSPDFSSGSAYEAEMVFCAAKIRTGTGCSCAQAWEQAIAEDEAFNERQAESSRWADEEELSLRAEEPQTDTY